MALRWHQARSGFLAGPSAADTSGGPRQVEGLGLKV